MQYNLWYTFFYQIAEELGVPVEGVFTHFADSWDNMEFTRQQLDTFYQCIAPYRSVSRIAHCSRYTARFISYRKGHLRFHAANTGAVLHGLATDLDFVRPGIGLYGLPPGDANMRFQSFGLKPAASIKGKPTLVKKLPPGTKVGYSCTYETADEEWVATFPVGYADGYWRHLSQAWFVVRDVTGECLS
jgi:alanine racemase